MSEMVNPEFAPELPMIYGCMESCMKEIGSITKSSQMNMQSKGGNLKYAYRSIDAVYNALQPAMIKAGITVVPKVIDYQRIPKNTQSGEYQNTVIVNMSFRWTAADGSYVETVVVNEGQDAGDKAFSKAMANAFKYAVFMTFVIPTEEMDMADPDHYRPEVENERIADEKKAPLKDRVAKAAKVTVQTPEEARAAKFDRRACINEAAAKVGYPDGLKTDEAKMEFGCMVQEAIKAGKAVDKKTGDMSPDELRACMAAIVEMFGKAS